MHREHRSYRSNGATFVRSASLRKACHQCARISTPAARGKLAALARTTTIIKPRRLLHPYSMNS